jgi:hypothetical protein
MKKKVCEREKEKERASERASEREYTHTHTHTHLDTGGDGIRKAANEPSPSATQQLLLPLAPQYPPPGKHPR